ncbi:MAG: spermidine/putrescine transport system substrate-binding protein [Chloroflexota bacterium]|jgi:spermidine/putrescine transport system substrate-binding protein|nr:spermidine/putrescine transport system substrate-binding protein [Chloroflexota bacterium]
MSELESRLTKTPVSRRRFLQGTALAGVSAFIAACTGTTGKSPTPSSAASVAASVAPSVSAAPATPKVISGPLKFANWTAYIDLAGAAGDAGEYKPGSSPTLEQFKKKYKVDVDYEEKINTNQTFLKTIEPALIAGLPTGWDLIVHTDSFAASLISKGWVEKIDHDNTPNCVANLRDALRNQSWDPGNDFHYPWQSGMTGVGYNVKALASANIPAPTKIADLWAIPSDKVTFLDEARDTFGLALLKLGIDPDPDKVTVDDLQKVADDIQPLVGKGLRFTGNDYVQDFGQKKVWAAMVWSGDLASSGGEDDKFVFPEEGVMIWTDNMVIPKGAANKYTAELMMDFVYDPVIAAQIADYVFYVSPVKGADEEIKKIDPDAASNPLLFPGPEIVAKQHNFQFLKPDVEKTMLDLLSTLEGT